MDVIVRFCVIGLCGVCVLVCDCSLLFFYVITRVVCVVVWVCFVLVDAWVVGLMLGGWFDVGCFGLVFGWFCFCLVGLVCCWVVLFVFGCLI